MSNLRQKAMLVRLNVKQFGNCKVDNRIHKTIAEAHHTKGRVGTYTRWLVPEEYINPLKKKVTSIRAIHYARTMPWLDSGLRILPSALYLDYIETIRDERVRLDRMVSELQGKRSEMIERAQAVQGDLFNPDAIPRDFLSEYSIEASVLPWPSAEDFRADIPDGELDIIKRTIEEDAMDGVRAGMRDAMERAAEAVKNMVLRLNAKRTVKSPDGTISQVPGTFHNTLVTNIEELISVLPAMNLTDDPEIDTAIGKMRELVRHSPAQLRSSESSRRHVASQAHKVSRLLDDIVSGLGAN